MSIWGKFFARNLAGKSKKVKISYELHGDHKIGPKGICLVCGHSLESIRRFGWDCKNPSAQTNDTHPRTMPDLSASKGLSPSKPPESQKKLLEASPCFMEAGASTKWWGKFFECPKPTMDFGLCSDDSCPCDPMGTPIKRGEGYLYISKEVVERRRHLLKLYEFEGHNAALRSLAIMKSGMPNDTRVNGLEKTGLPILVCEQGAKLRNLDLAVAHEDAKRWWETGKVPLRVTPVTVQGSIVRVFARHFQRIRAEFRDHQPTMDILNEVEARFQENASRVAEMAKKTLADHKLHTKCLSGGGIRSWLLVSVVPRDRHKSASFFATEYPPGYGGYMNFWLNSMPLQQAREMGHDVFAHILIYADASSQEKLSLGFGLFPLDPSNDTNPGVIMPSESLTREDKAEFGV